MILAMQLFLLSSVVGGPELAAVDQEVYATSTTQLGPESLVFSGAIIQAPWATDFTVANPTASPIEVYLTHDPNPPLCSPLLGCPAGVRIVNVPPNGVASGPDPGAFYGGVTTTYASEPGTELVPVSARIRRMDQPAVGVDIPAVRLSAILAANPQQLVFTGARQGSAGRSNLVLTNVQRIPPPATGGGLSVRIEAFAANGSVVGSLAYSLAYGQTLFLHEVIAQIGVDELPAGLLRVVKTGGDGVMWGVLYSVDSSGSVSATVGAYL